MLLKISKKNLPLLLDGYKLSDIYNCDETGIPYRPMPDRPLHVRKDGGATGGKRSKERLTQLLCSNCFSDFEKPHVIGKAVKPRCFKSDIKNLPMTWRYNSKAWMTSKIFRVDKLIKRSDGSTWTQNSVTSG